MRQSFGRSLVLPFADRHFRLLVWFLIGLVGWLGVIVIGISLFSTAAPQAGFDLELVLEAGRRVAAGMSPYAPGLIQGAARLQAVDLFYSYPPPVAQAFSALSALPSGSVLVVLGILAVAGVAFVSRLLAAALDRVDPPIDLVVPTLAVLPFLFPFSVALLFGNLDAFYPLAYGLLLLSILAPTRKRVVAGGIGLGLVSVAKLHPSLVLLWLLVRGLRDRRQGKVSPITWQVATVAIGTALFVIAASLLIGGVGPWLDYGSVLRTASGADLVLRNNIGPTAQIALLTGAGEGAARTLQVPVLIGAVVATIWAAWRRADPLESLVWAAVASLVVLPITWFHYAAAMIPFALAAVARSRGGPDAGRAAGLVGFAILVGFAAIALPVLVWLAIALTAAAQTARPGRPQLRGTT